MMNVEPQMPKDDLTQAPEASDERHSGRPDLVRDLDAMTRLQKLGALPMQASNLTAVLAEVVDAAITISGADFGNIQLLDPASGDLRIVAQRGFSPEWIMFWDSVAKGNGSCGTALERGEQVIVEDVEQSPIFAGSPALDVQRQAGVRAVQSTPLVSRSGQVLGMFSTHFKTPHRPDERSLLLLDLLARQAADFIERAQIEQALRDTRDFLEETERIGKIGGWEFDIDTGQQTWTDEVYRIHEVALDYQPTVEKGIAFYAPESRPVIERAVQRAIQFGEPFDLELAFITAKGNHRWVHAIGRADLPRRRVYGFFQEITEHKQAEQSLRESEERLRLAQDAARIGTFDWDIVSGVIVWQPETERLWGLPVGGFEGSYEHWRKLVHSDDLPQAEAIARRALAEPDVPYEFEHRIIWPDGTVRWLFSKAITIWAADKPIRMVGLNMDITDRKQAEAALRKLNETLEQQVAARTAALHDQSEQLRAFLNTAADAIVTIDRKGTIRVINPATARMFGYTSEELLGQNVKVLMPPPFRDEHDGYLARYLETGQPRIIGIGRELSGLRKDGSTFPIDVSISEIDHLGLFTGILHDATSRKRLQQEILEVAAAEQRRIGHELHDGTQQELTGLSLMAGTLLDVLKSVPEERTGAHSIWHFGHATYSRLADIAMKLSQGLANANLNVKQLAHGILPVQIDAHGLRSALEELAATTNEASRMNCRFDCHQPVTVANNTVATNLYRIAQEAVTNALRHSHATDIVISLTRTDGQLELIVRDNGIGFDPSSIATQSANSNHHMGLRIMDYRASLIGGTLRISRAEPDGTIVRCLVPHGMTE